MKSNEIINKNGHLFLNEFHPDSDSATVISLLGAPVALGDGCAVHSLAPATTEASTPNTYSGMYGLGAFPFHTDLAHWRTPPRYLALRCVVGFEDVPTLLLDGDEIVSVIGKNLLSRSLVQPRRPIKGRLPLFRLLQSSEERDLLRWDEVFIRPASDVGKAGFREFKTAIESQTPIRISLSKPGDTVIIDNWRMLHARSAIRPEHQSRKIERAYLEDIA